MRQKQLKKNCEISLQFDLLQILLFNKLTAFGQIKNDFENTAMILVR